MKKKKSLKEKIEDITWNPYVFCPGWDKLSSTEKKIVFNFVNMKRDYEFRNFKTI